MSAHEVIARGKEAGVRFVPEEHLPGSMAVAFQDAARLGTLACELTRRHGGRVVPRINLDDKQHDAMTRQHVVDAVAAHVDSHERAGWQANMIKNKMRPIHPGEVLLEEYLRPLDLSANRLAQVIDVPANRISASVAEERNITADTALRLSKALRTTPEFWMNLQQAFELRTAEQDKKTAAAVKNIKAISKTR